MYKRDPRLVSATWLPSVKRQAESSLNRTRGVDVQHEESYIFIIEAMPLERLVSKKKTARHCQPGGASPGSI
jgi:hypothetical protein